MAAATHSDANEHAELCGPAALSAPSASGPVRDDPTAIVGIGGSAGSLTPLRELIGALPAQSGMAFVVVSHQASTGQSLLPEILEKITDLPVREIEDEMKALPDHIYVAPRGSVVSLHNSVFSIAPIGDPGRHSLPIDSFFRALARDRAHGAVGIILSGTARDGTLGLTAIRAESGLCLAQDPETAEFRDMPASAIAAGATDFVLPVGEMPERLVAYARSVRAPGNDGESPEISPDAMKRILTLIRVRGGHDFGSYKRDTLVRRVERRMDLHRIARSADYLRFLETNHAEIDALWRDWLISVSAFFRDPEAFEALAEVALPPLLAARAGASRLRAWVPGCATGEEAYSIAIVLLETLEARGEHLDIQVFATDLDPSVIETARAGRYPKAIAEVIGKRRLARFFVEDEHGYRARKELRDRIVFAVQDVLHDPPFTRIDLISCRNLLIYLVPSAQQDLLSVFHYSLNPEGVLLLGASEHVGGPAKLFSTLDRRWRLYRRSDAGAARPALRWASHRTATAPGAVTSLAGEREIDLTETLRTCLAERFGPPAVVVDLAGRIRQTHGRVGPYLELPPGRANLNVLEMARDGLRAPLTAALRAIAKSGARSVEKEVRTRTEEGLRDLRLTVSRIDDRRLPSPLLLVSFEPIASPGGSSRTRTSSSKASKPKRARLEEELDHMRQDLRGSITDLQAANEELASANEEAQSANEELQSSNEELQTSKEETQSLNEELQTVNAELAEKLRRLEQANDDLLNLMSNLEIATIFLDDQLRVKRFTPQARSVARLIDTDVGRPLADLATLLDYPDLLSDAESVLASLHSMEKQAPAPGGIWYTVRIRPYRTTRNAVEGLVVTFIDITATKRAERVQAASFLAESIVDAVREPLLVLDPALRVVRANRSFYGAFHVEPAETEGQLVGELGNHQWKIPRLQGLLEATLRDGSPFEEIEIVHEFPQLGRRRMVVSGRPVSIEGEEKPVLIVLGIQDAGPAASGEDGDA